MTIKYETCDHKLKKQFQQHRNKYCVVTTEQSLSSFTSVYRVV